MKAPAFQMYAADIYMDTNEWSAEAFGIYNRLLQHQWVNGSIPKDLKKLAQISFVDIKKMTKRWPEMESKFEFDETNRGRNIRLEITRQKQLQYSEKQREKGKKRAEKMWEGHIATANTTAKKRLQPKDSSSSSSSSSTSLKEKDKKIYGTHLLLTDDEYVKLQVKYDSHLADIIEYMDLKIESKGLKEWRKQYKSDYATILVWDKKGWLDLNKLKNSNDPYGVFT